MKIALAADHAGFEVKEQLKQWLTEQGHTLCDFGTQGKESCDYADYAGPAAAAVASGKYERGIFVCGSGQGVNITANKVVGIRSALCWLPELAAVARQHNDANVLCMAARFTPPELLLPIVTAFLSEKFEGGRHACRIGKIAGIEKKT